MLPYGGMVLIQTTGWEGNGDMIKHGRISRKMDRQGKATHNIKDILATGQPAMRARAPGEGIFVYNFQTGKNTGQ